MNHPLRLISTLGLALALGACGTFGSGPQQAVYIDTGKARDAKCVLISPAIGRVRMSAPGQVTVRRSPHNVRIVCRQAGYSVGRRVMRSSFSALAVGNSYPDRVRVPMKKLAAGPDEGDGELKPTTRRRGGELRPTRRRRGG